MPSLPVESTLPELRAALADARSAVLVAEPGAGKTTRVPLALLDESWLGGRCIVLLEPRRLAARAAARYMAATLGEVPGETVGYRTRLESRVGPKTRIEVVTEGILTRRLLSDPAIEDVGLVIFDEFHERSLQADLGLALALDARSLLREDLRLLVMSATIDAAAVAGLLGGVPVVSSTGRSFPVETRHLPAPKDVRDLPAASARIVREAIGTETGSVLVFLPGQGEIRRTEAALAESGLPPDIEVLSLYGALPPEAQDRAIRPAGPGRRKVVLASAIAETSLTIEGVRVVIDAGLARVPCFDPVTGMNRLETRRVTRDSADQRRGRAGRLEPGICYRLWSEAEDARLVPHRVPEILEADLAGLVLDLARWGTHPEQLAWLDPPPAAALSQARDLLAQLGALDETGRLTPHGEAMAAIGVHPRLAHMLIVAKSRGSAPTACRLAALVEERDILSFPPGEGDADLRLRLDVLETGRVASPGARLHKAALESVRTHARRLAERLGVPWGAAEPEVAGLLAALAWPDRVAMRRPDAHGRFLLASGRGAFLPEADALAVAQRLAIAEIDAGEREARIRLAAPLGHDELETACGTAIRIVETVEWDGREGAVLARRRRRLGALVLEDAPLDRPDPEAVTAAITRGIRSAGLGCLPWTREAGQLRARVAFLRHVEPDGGWPDWSDAHLIETLEDWLGPYLGGMSRLAHLSRLDLADILGASLSWPQRRDLDERAPTHIAVPSGSRIRIDYESGETPVLAVRIQELFGLAETPRVAGGRVPLLLHLLSPARRPVQVTQDLAGFWRGAWVEVRKELKGRYPKHPWPDDPLAAAPTARAKPRG